ncbi:MAG: ATP-binding protein [Candidatus Micrarchaeia archaeon]
MAFPRASISQATPTTKPPASGMRSFPPEVESVLREEAHRILDTLPESVFEFDRFGRISFANTASMALLGYRLEDVLGQGVLSLVSDTDRARAFTDLSRVLGGEMIGAVEYSILDSEGKSRLMRINTMPLISEGEVIGARGVAIDLSEQREVELRYRESQAELAAANAMRMAGECAARAGHDLNNLLGIVCANIGFIREIDLRGLPNDERGALESSLADITVALERSCRLVKEMMQLSSPISMGKDTIQLEAIIRSVVGGVRNLCARNNIRMVLDLQENVGGILGNKDKLCRAFHNLVTNAIDAMPHGGTLTISSARHTTDTGMLAILSITDTGYGMSDSVRSKIFQPFFTTKGENGTGLGLPITLNFIRAHGGSISVESAEGLGSTFEVVLPVCETWTSS